MAGSRSADDRPTTRTVSDALGAVEIPSSALWGSQTQRAIDSLPFDTGQMPAEVIHALGLVKSAAARANVDVGVLHQGIGEAVVAAADEVAAGLHDDQFPVDVFQTGSGTATNMNANEVIAALASTRLGEAVHPNDHVNASQSSNDVIPSAIHLAAARAVTGRLIPALWHLHAALERQAIAHAATVKAGRTHLMDAAPVTFGHELLGYATQVLLGAERLEATLPRLYELPLGGTAVGTGLNAPDGFADAAITWLAGETHLPLRPARNGFEAQSARDALVELSAQLKVVAVGLLKICTDLRWLGSGPRTGLAEIQLPELLPGSSIMPGKVNPIVPEAVSQACMQVVGNDTAVTLGGLAGTFELNTAMPLIARNVCESVRLLAVGARLLADRAVDGLTVDAGRMRAYAEASPAAAAALNRLVGYDTASRVVKHALAHQTSVRQAALDLGLVTEGLLTNDQLDAALDVERLARGDSGSDRDASG